MTGKDRAEGGEYVETTSTQAVLTVMRDTDAPIVTVGDVAKAVDASRETARRKLTDPYERGRIERREIGASAVVWWVPDKEGSQAASYLSWKAINDRYGDDQFGQNPGWADGLEDLGENA